MTKLNCENFCRLWIFSRCCVFCIFSWLPYIYQLLVDSINFFIPLSWTSLTTNGEFHYWWLWAACTCWFWWFPPVDDEMSSCDWLMISPVNLGVLYRPIIVGSSSIANLSFGALSFFLFLEQTANTIAAATCWSQGEIRTRKPIQNCYTQETGWCEWYSRLLHMMLVNPRVLSLKNTTIATLTADRNRPWLLYKESSLGVKWAEG